MATIYVELNDDGTLCYRPVEAHKNDDDSYTILSTPDDEVWNFQPTDTVLCEERIDGNTGKKYLLAIRKIS